MLANKPFLPPEWHPQSGVLLTWPHAQTDWAPQLSQAEATFVELARAIALHEKVVISCFDAAHRRHVSTILQQANTNMQNIACYIAPSNDSWARDHGPITILQNQQPTLLDFTFNAWGGKYNSNLDNEITVLLQQQNAFGQTPLRSIPFILEGGSIEVDGAGSLLTTAHCLLTPTRNQHLSRQQVEQQLQELLGIQQVLWLEQGNLAGDDTDSHIDTLARFTDAHTICYMKCDDTSDIHHAPLQAMEQELARFRDCNGKPYRLVPLPWPKACYNSEGLRLPATYANFLIINNAVLVPTYQDAADTAALQQLQSCFPDREIIGIDCRALIAQYGSLHCVTMQLPAGVVP